MFKIFQKEKFPTALFVSASLVVFLLMPLLLGILKSALKNKPVAANEKNFYSGTEIMTKESNDPLITKTSNFKGEK